LHTYRIGGFPLMDEDGFRKFLTKKKKTQNTISNCIAGTKELEDYLVKKSLSLNSLTVSQIETFIAEYLDKKRIPKFLWEIGYYFSFIEREDLLHLAQNVRSQHIKKRETKTSFRIKNFRGINPSYIAVLALMGIKDANSMLKHGKTPKLRKELAKKSGLEDGVIEELVRLSDLSRIRGVKGIRARLYCDAGFDSCEKISKSTKEEILTVTKKFVEETGFEGIAPLPKEVAFTIRTAKNLPDIIEW
jgi:hypothetical protein